DDGPRQVPFGGSRSLVRKGANACCPMCRVTLPVVDHDGRVGGRATRAEGDGVGELIDRARVVPDVGGMLGDGAPQGGSTEGQGLLGSQRWHRLILTAV